MAGSIYNRGGGGGGVDLGTWEDITADCSFDTTNGTFSYSSIKVNEKLGLISVFLQFNFNSYPSGFTTNEYEIIEIPSKYEFVNKFIELGHGFDDVYNAPVMAAIGVSVCNYEKSYDCAIAPVKSNHLYLTYNLAGISSYKLKTARVSFFQPITVN